MQFVSIPSPNKYCYFLQEVQVYFMFTMHMKVGHESFHVVSVECGVPSSEFAPYVAGCPHQWYCLHGLPAVQHAGMFYCIGAQPWLALNLYISHLAFSSLLHKKTIRYSTFTCRIWWALFQDKTPTCLPSSPTCLVSSLCTSRSADLWINNSLCGKAYSHTISIPFWQRIYFNAS